MASDTRRNPEAAVGSQTHDRWLALGRMQFDYLVEHGLAPGARMLDIGCGNLRAGWRFIDHLEAGHYYGIDISPDILIAAKRTLTAQGLQAKVPHLTITKDLTLDFLPDAYFDVVHAHSVFSQPPEPPHPQPVLVPPRSRHSRSATPAAATTASAGTTVSRSTTPAEYPIATNGAPASANRPGVRSRASAGRPERRRVAAIGIPNRQST